MAYGKNPYLTKRPGQQQNDLYGTNLTPYTQQRSRYDQPNDLNRFTGQQMAPQQKSQVPGESGVKGFINLSRYIDANQGAGQAMADKVAGGIERSGEMFNKQPIGQAGVTVADAEGERDQFGHLKMQNLTPTRSAYAPPPVSNPNASWINMNAPINDLGAAKATEAKAKQAATEEGREELLGEAYGKTGYNEGEQDLDSFLMGNAGGDRLGQLSKKYGGLSKLVQGRLDAEQDALGKEEIDYAKTIGNRKRIMAEEDAASAAERARIEEENTVRLPHMGDALMLERTDSLKEMLQGRGPLGLGIGADSDPISQSDMDFLQSKMTQADWAALVAAYQSIPPTSGDATVKSRAQKAARDLARQLIAKYRGR